MGSFVNCTKEWKREPIPSKKRDDQASETHQPQRVSRKQGQSETSSSIEPSRKLEPASKVLSRLEYDATYDIDEFKVGYLDRFKNEVQEKAAAGWKKDKTHEEFIPEHRIEYFKRYSRTGKPEIVWEKKTKVDKVFWSGNSVRE